MFSHVGLCGYLSLSFTRRPNRYPIQSPSRSENQAEGFKIGLIFSQHSKSMKEIKYQLQLNVTFNSSMASYVLFNVKLTWIVCWQYEQADLDDCQVYHYSVDFSIILTISYQIQTWNYGYLKLQNTGCQSKNQIHWFCFITTYQSE